MLRSVTLGLVLSVLAAACALVEPPIPAGTTLLRAIVRNERGPVELTVTTPAGVLPGAVQPASVPANTTADVTFYVPITGQWSIAIDGSPDIPGSDLGEAVRSGCRWGLELNADGGMGYGCSGVP